MKFRTKMRCVSVTAACLENEVIFEAVVRSTPVRSMIVHTTDETYYPGKSYWMEFDLAAPEPSE